MNYILRNVHQEQSSFPLILCYEEFSLGLQFSVHFEFVEL
jgi:hypothetical protein